VAIPAVSALISATTTPDTKDKPTIRATVAKRSTAPLV
jgi:hypothetical protein